MDMGTDRGIKIVFFDGCCPMCHRWVKWILRRDKRQKLHFSPLEGKTAGELLLPLSPAYMEEDTLIYYDQGRIWMRSDAVMAIARDLGWPYNLIRWGRLIPRWIREGLYRRVAADRFRSGARYETCPLPPAAWKERFI